MSVYIERGPRGHPQFVRGGSQRSRRDSDRVLLNQAEETIADLTTRLSYSEEQAWRLQNIEADYQAFRNAHRNCGELRTVIEERNAEIRGLERDRADEKDKAERYKERLRLMRRQCGGGEGYRERLEAANREIQDLSVRLIRKDEEMGRVDGLVRRMGETIRSQDRRIEDQDRRIETLIRRLRYY